MHFTHRCGPSSYRRRLSDRLAHLDEMRRPSLGGMRYAPNEKRTQGAIERRPAMRKHCTVTESAVTKQRANRKLTMGIDLGDRSSRYCMLDNRANYWRRAAWRRPRRALPRYWDRKPRSRVALEVGTHSLWVSRYLAALVSRPVRYADLLKYSRFAEPKQLIK